jgi:hypothetical protein
MEYFWIFAGLLLYIILMIPQTLFRAAKKLWLTWTGKSPNIKKGDI